MRRLDERPIAPEVKRELLLLFLKRRAEIRATGAWAPAEAQAVEEGIEVLGRTFPDLLDSELDPITAYGRW